MHKSLDVLTGFLILSMNVPPGLAQSAQPFASTPEYQSMLTELARQAPRPSRIADAGELITGKQSDVPVEERESVEGFKLEAQAWALEITKDPFGMTFTNKPTGVDWKLASVSYEGSGATSGRAAKESATPGSVRLVRARSLEQRPGRWVFVGMLEGSPP